ncbi:hypothetical protein [Enterocloster hominis (ex Hitch et al. 2024)]|nr:hypothetical protein [Lachnoclostridium pacaense]
MNFIIVCNNLNSGKDGIGKYGKMIGSELGKQNDVQQVHYCTG